MWVISQFEDVKSGREIRTLVYIQAIKDIEYTSQKVIGSLEIMLSDEELKDSLQSKGVAFTGVKG